MRFEWKSSKLEDVLEAILDYRGKTPKKAASGIPLITAKIVKNGSIQQPDEFIAESDYSSWMVRGLPKAGDVVLTTEAPLGEVAQLKTDRVALAQRIVTLRGYQNVLDNGYLKYFLMSKIGQSRLKERESGTTVSGIKQSELRQIRIDYPEFLVQRSIAQILSSIDDKIEVNNAISKNLEEIANALFKRWFVDFEFLNEDGKPYKSSGGEFEDSVLGPIPKGWKIGTATDLFEVQSGGTPKTSVPAYWGGEIPFFTPKDCRSSFYVIITEKSITNKGLENCNSRLYKTETVFITARGTVGKVAMAGRDMAMNQSCYALVAKSGYTQKYVFHQIRQLVKVLQKNASGAVFDAITVATFQNLKTILPDTDLVMRFDRAVGDIHRMIHKNIIENQTLQQIRDTLLPKLMSGEIRVPVEQEQAQQQTQEQQHSDYQPSYNDLPMAAESKADYQT